MDISYSKAILTIENKKPKLENVTVIQNQLTQVCLKEQFLAIAFYTLCE